MKPFILSVLTLCVFSLAFCSGCGHKPVENPNRTTAHGKVVFKGEPLRCGSVTFVSKENPKRRATCIIGAEGTFSLDNIPKGSLQVAVETESVKQGGDESLYVQIPKKYNTVEKSGLSTEMVEGSEELIITLE